MANRLRELVGSRQVIVTNLTGGKILSNTPNRQLFLYNNNLETFIRDFTYYQRKNTEEARINTFDPNAFDLTLPNSILVVFNCVNPNSNPYWGTINVDGSTTNPTGSAPPPIAVRPQTAAAARRRPPPPTNEERLAQLAVQTLMPHSREELENAAAINLQKINQSRQLIIENKRQRIKLMQEIEIEDGRLKQLHIWVNQQCENIKRHPDILTFEITTSGNPIVQVVTKDIVINVNNKNYNLGQYKIMVNTTNADIGIRNYARPNRFPHPFVNSNGVPNLDPSLEASVEDMIAQIDIENVLRVLIDFLKTYNPTETRRPYITIESYPNV